MDEGDSPYAEKSCTTCGLVATPLALWASRGSGTCPSCSALWPAHLEERAPYDGKNRVTRWTSTDAQVEHVRVSYERGWRVGDHRSVYAPTNPRFAMTEQEAVEMAAQCLLLDCTPASLGKAREEAPIRERVMRDLLERSKRSNSCKTPRRC
jgi:hypothetical protein